MARRVTPGVLWAAQWALRASWSVRRQLHSRSPIEVRVPKPPGRLSEDAFRGVRYTLRQREALCLERSLVYQEWLAARGEYVDVVIGVSNPNDFKAHAWLDGWEPEAADEFAELVRRSAQVAPARSARRWARAGS
jgi:hypothetical protein